MIKFSETEDNIKNLFKPSIHCNKLPKITFVLPEFLNRDMLYDGQEIGKRGRQEYSKRGFFISNGNDIMGS